MKLFSKDYVGIGGSLAAGGKILKVDTDGTVSCEDKDVAKSLIKFAGFKVVDKALEAAMSEEEKSEDKIEKSEDKVSEEPEESKESKEPEEVKPSKKASDLKKAPKEEKKSLFNMEKRPSFARSK